MTNTALDSSNFFAVPAEGYDRLMGRYLPALAPAFADAAGIRAGMRALDVGCGPGGLTRELVARLGAAAVAAIDPSPPFVQACHTRNPGVDVREGAAEQLPFPDRAFDATLASLAVGFMTDADAGAREMARVTKPGGVVAACFWDLAQMPAIGTFWAAATAVDPSTIGEAKRLGTTEGDLRALLSRAGLSDVEETTIRAHADYANFEDWWTPFTLGVGPIGIYFQSLPADQKDAIKQASRDLLGNPAGAFTLRARAWCARGTV